MNCPRCKDALRTETVSDAGFLIEVDNCKNCGGTWFDESELQRIENITEPTIWETRNIPSMYDQLEALYCPKCEGGQSILMKKAEHHRDDKVIMDYCENCGGIWLDKGELEAIQTENWFKTLWTLFVKLHG